MIKAFFIAFSTYSKIPVPQLPWKEADMKYVLCFFPWVGAVIGAVVFLWHWFCTAFAIGGICQVLIGTAIPVAVTGGFHLDGYMDTMDALHSYQERDRKLAILKDAHIGAFAVLMLLFNGLLYMAAYSEIAGASNLAAFCCSFFLSRTLSGIAVVHFPAAKKEGTLFFFSDTAHKKTVRTVLYLQLALCSAFLVKVSVKTGGMILFVAAISFLSYYYRSKKEFGGITGDTAGYFVTVCETAAAVAAAVGSRL